MEIKNQSNLKYPLLLGGITIASGLSYLVYKNYLQNNSDLENLSLDQVKDILKDFRKEMFPILNDIRVMAKNIYTQIIR